MAATQQSQQDQQFNRNPVRNIAALAPPYMLATHGTLGAVRIVAFGDQEGSSPVSKIVDRNGSMRWVTDEELRVIDPLPYSTETLNALAAQGDIQQDNAKQQTQRR